MFQRTKSFCNDNHGSIALSFALTLPLMVAGSGTAVDYSRASNLRSSIQASSDAGVLAANLMMIATKDLNKSQAEGRAVFMANMHGLDPEAVLGEFDITLIESTPPKFRVVANATKKRVMPFLQSGPIEVSVISEAEAQMKQTESPYSIEAPTEIILAADTSGSMGMAASTVARDRLVAATTAEQVRLGLDSYYGGCAFACHSPWGGHERNFYDLARANNAQLRMDVSKNAMRIVSNRALGDASKGHRISLFSFDQEVTQVQELSKSRSVVNNAIDTLDYTSTASSFNITMPKLAEILNSQVSGKGMRKDAAKALIILTDGMHYEPPYWGAIKPETCAALKTTKLTVAILELKYLPGLFPNPAHVDHKNITDAAIPLISPALKSCVSDPSLYAVASEPVEVETAIGILLTTVMKVAQKPVLTK